MSQFDRDIEELLRSLGDLGPRETGWQRFRRGLATRWETFWWNVRALPRAVPADQLMIAALLFVVAAYFLRFALPGVARFVGLLGVGMFVAAFFFSFNQLFGSRREIRWRGQPIDIGRGQSGFMDRLVLWLRRKLRGL